jgi:FkbM family methyltransferase
MTNNFNIVELNTKFGYMSYFSNDLAFVNELKKGKIYEQEYVIEFLFDIIKKSNVIIDAGAHAGSHTIIYKYINPEAIIHCFEPQLYMYTLLKHNILKNDLQDVYAYNNALANKKAETTLTGKISDGAAKNMDIHYGGNIYSNLGGIKIGSGGEKINTITIDSLNLESCDFIKMDVEGFEPIVLLGAIETIKKFKPTILFENNYQKVSDDVLKKFDVDKEQYDTLKILKDIGYSNIKLIDNNYNYLAVYGDK